MNIRKCVLDMKHSSSKKAFWDVNNKKWLIWYKIEATFLFDKTYGLHVLSKDTKCPNQLFYVPLVVLHTICAK
jgi:hypothetical protein